MRFVNELDSSAKMYWDPLAQRLHMQSKVPKKQHGKKMLSE